MLWALKLIPGVSQAIQWLGSTAIQLYSAKLSAQGTHEQKVLDLAKRAVDLDEIEARLNAQSKTEIRHVWYAPENLFAYLIAIPYFFKVITIDNTLGSLLGLHLATPALRGDTAKAMTMILVFWLGARGIQNVASIIGAAFGKR